MNDTNKSFTGRTRERKTKPSVHVANRIAKYVITLGGIGTIFSVLLVAFFLIYVVIPLFMPPSLDYDEAFTFSDLSGNAEFLMLGVNDYMDMSYVVLNDGTLLVYNLIDGSILSRQSLFDEETEANNEPVADSETEDPIPAESVLGDEAAEESIQPKITSFASANSDDTILFGFDNGTVQLGSIGFKSEFISPEDMPAEFHDIEIDTPTTFRKGVVQKTLTNQFRYQELSIEMIEPIVVSATGSPVIHVDYTNAPSGESFVSLMLDGTLKYNRISTNTNMLTGKATITTRGGSTEVVNPYPELRTAPLKVLLSGLGEYVYVIWAEGKLLRYNSRDMNKIELMETIDLLDDSDSRITQAAFMIGKRSLLFGKSTGEVDVWFPIQPDEGAAADGVTLVEAHKLYGGTAEVTSLAFSERSRKLAAGFADGTVRLYYSTNNTMLAEGQLAESNDPIFGLIISPKEDYLLAMSENRSSLWEINAPHPETTLEAMFLPVWYEGYTKPEHVWQTSSGTDDFEPKYGLWPLIFGTLKATFYSLLFGVPLALLAAIYTSEFLHPKFKTAFKPTIEMMASLPSVVLGFIAGIVLAPFVEDIVPEVMVGIFAIPFILLLCSYTWQLIPPSKMVRAQRYRLWAVLASLPIGLWFTTLVARPIESVLFAGDIKAWLADHSIGNGVGGWMILFIPISAFAVSIVSGRLAPVLRRFTAGWSATKYAWFDLGKFLASVLLTIVIALMFSWILTVAGFDPRGSYIDTYIQRNALIVGFIMGFAIIPIIYTIAEDALSAVPAHLRAGSLGAGATPWQTAVRIIIPTAMSGLFSAIMIGLGRAVGETMIVLMAAGNTPVLDLNIFNGFRTLSANIAVELPEAVRNSTHYRSLFFAALVLFILTFIVNTLAEIVRQRFRKRSSQL